MLIQKSRYSRYKTYTDVSTFKFQVFAWRRRTISSIARRGTCHAALARSMAPSMYIWEYVGGEDDSPDAARRGEQRTRTTPRGRRSTTSR